MQDLGRPRAADSPGSGPRSPEYRDGHPVSAPSFDHFDFAQLWQGRETTTRVEQEVVRRLLPSGTDRRRALEIGTGGGRIAAGVGPTFQEYVATDLTPKFLAHPTWQSSPPARMLAADVHHLPFRDGVFTVVIMVRVFNFLPDPRGALSEIVRVLTPGGWVVFSYFAEPSVGTLVRALRSALSGSPGEDGGLLRAGRASETLSWRDVERQIRDAGLTVGQKMGTGLDDLRILRRLPASLYAGLAGLAAPLPWFPHTFTAAQRPGKPPERLDPIDEILACPLCHLAFPHHDDWSQVLPPCDSCGFSPRASDRVLDLRPPSPTA
jgi:SAM-dependent methyltransferase